MFLYHDIQWSSGTTIGFNAGDGLHYITIPESLTADGVLNLDSTSNVGIPGMYIYRVDQDPCMFNAFLSNFIEMFLTMIVLQFHDATVQSSDRSASEQTH